MAGALCGITPVWASEVEPYPIAVTRSRFPQMRHIGDVSKVSGAGIELVDIITFGSPCQDLSVAGKRAGLKHTENGDEETTRSGLFMEAVRIIKEMRKASGNTGPDFAVWENVPGAFSSNKGEDFRIVLEELAKVTDPEAVVPRPPKGKWPKEGSIMGDGWSLAWRTMDAQYWGVPQRRRRIYLVADFRGERAGKVLFKRKGLRGYFEEGRSPWKTTPTDAGRGPAATDREGNCLTPWDVQSRRVFTADGPWPALYAGEGGGHGYVIYDARGNGDGIAPTITGDHNCRVTDYTALAVCIPINNKATRWQGGGTSRNHDGSGNGLGIGKDGDPAPTLTAGDKHIVAYAMQEFGKYAESDTTSALKARDYKDTTDLVVFDNNSFGGYKPGVETLTASRGAENIVVKFQKILYIVRRLTPTECARLQGFADEWAVPDHKDDFTNAECQFWQGVRDTYAEINGKRKKLYTKAQLLKWYNGLYTDSAEYKMWGNGIALPTALYVLQGIADCLEVRNGQSK